MHYIIQEVILLLGLEYTGIFVIPYNLTVFAIIYFIIVIGDLIAHKIMEKYFKWKD